MSATSRRQDTGLGDSDTAVVVALLGLLLAALGGVWAVAHLGAWLDGGPDVLPRNPIELAVQLFTGESRWPAHAVWAGAVVVVALALLVLAVSSLWSAVRSSRRSVDRAARHMGGGRDISEITTKGARKSADRFGITGAPGLPIGRAVGTGQHLVSDFESCTVDIWGPRRGKSTSRVIPAILANKGPVVTTSNRRDTTDATRDLRAQMGTVWVFDPQEIVGEPASWWWNPLSYVTDEVKAIKLASLFAASTAPANGKSDDFFRPAAIELLGNLLLAAAVGGRPITQVYLWLCDSTDKEPVGLLDAGGYPLNAASVRGTINDPDKQRKGVYGGAKQIVSFLTSRTALRWVTDNGGRRRHFDAARFAHSTDTLYLLSREGEGTTGPLVTALTAVVCEAAERLAMASPGGRLAVPMGVILDEVANVCRWPELPNLFSHYGGRGMPVMAVLQSWSQGVDTWGRDGMRKLWSAANVKVYGGGVSEVDFLSDLSQLIGTYQRQQTSHSTSRGGGSTSRSVTSESILDVADLAAMPRGRVVVMAAGAPAVLAEPQMWTTGPHAAAIRASIHAHDPAAEATLAEVDAALAAEKATAGIEPDVQPISAVRARNPWAGL